MNGPKDLSLHVFAIGIAALFNFALGQYVETPEKWFAPRGSDAQIPCITDASNMDFHHYNRDRSRINKFMERGDPNLMILTISDVRQSDTMPYRCQGDGVHSMVQLVVYEPSEPVLSVGVTPSNNVKLTWTPPPGPRDAVLGYKIYVKEVAGQVGVANFEVVANTDSQEQNFLLEDLKPGATYDIQVAAKYIEGASDDSNFLDGPMSAKVRIDTPHFTSPPVKVKVTPGTDSTILVTWKKPTNLEENAIDGYKVIYQAVPPQGNRAKGEVNVTSRADSGQWQAVLEGLPIKTRYEIAVYAIQNGVYGKKSQSVLYRHEGFAPELSIRAFALSPDTVLVSVSTVGGEDVRRLRVLWSDDSATKWTRIEKCSLGGHCVVSGLQPRSKYFFVARARVGGRSRHVVTHAVTLPSELAMPLDMTVKALTDHSIRATWLYPNKNQPIGYILTVEVKETDDQEYRPFKQEVVYGTQSAMVDGFRSYEQYRARVTAFNTNGKGNPSETVEFTISSDGVDGTTEAPIHNPPKFIDVPAKMMQIDAGENITLTCIALGDPNPMVQWTSNDSVISYPRDRTNIVNLVNIQESKTVTCKAENEFGKIYHEVRIDVSHGLGTFPMTTTTKSSPLRRAVAPSLVRELPLQLRITRGGPVRLLCEFEGFPVPRVTWYENNRRIGLGNYGSSLLTITSLESSSEMICEGRNSLGMERHKVRLVLVETTTRPAPTTTTAPQPLFEIPTLAGEMPSKIERRQGEALHLRCRFNGNPTPIVRWYQNNQPIGAGSRQESILAIPAVKYSSSLMCEGRNRKGIGRHTIQLVVKQIEVNRPELKDYKVSLRYVPKSRDSAIVKWVIDEGDISAIRNFNVTIRAAEFPLIIMQDLMPRTTRRLTLNRLTPDIRYFMKVETMTSLGTVNVVTMEFEPSQNVPPTDESLLLLEAMEIRHNSARIDFTAFTTVRRFRLRVKDLEANILSNIILDRNLPQDSPSINVLRLKALREYQVILDAYPVRGNEKITSRVRFMTAAPGRAGISVASRSDGRLTTAAPIRIVTTAATPPRPTTTTTTTTTTTSTTTTPTTTTPRVIPETSDEPTGNGYELTLRTSYKTSSSVNIRWNVNKGDLDAIGGFLFKIKQADGTDLIEQQLNRQQRSIGIQSLTPNTRYLVNVKVRRPNTAILDEAEITINTLSRNAIRDTRNPFLELEVNEIRSSSVRVEWIIVNGDPSDVASYVLNVFDRNARGNNLLTQNLASNSGSLDLRALPANRQFHVVVDALDRNKRVKMSSAVTFITAKSGQYGTPVRSSRNRSGNPSPPVPPAPIRLSTPSPDQGGRSFLQVDIVPSLPNGARLTFHQESDIPVKELKVVAKLDDSNGQLLLSKYLPKQTSSYVIRGLMPRRVYYLEVDSLDRQGNTLARVETSYRLPPPGHDVEAITVTSSESDRKREDDRYPVISGVTRLNGTSAVVRWQNSASVSPNDSVMIRFSKYQQSSQLKLSSRIIYSGARNGKIALLDLEEGSTYGFQISKLQDPAKWSPIFFYAS